MSIEGKCALVLGGAGLVGVAVCRELAALHPEALLVASRQRSRAEQTVQRLRADLADTPTRIVPVWGDVFVRAQWQTDVGHPRATALADPARRRRLIADVLDPLDEEIIGSSLLAQIIEGRFAGVHEGPVQVIVDCINTATALSYQDVYAVARRLADLAVKDSRDTDWPKELEGLLASLYVPQLVRHVQLLHEAMRRAGTEAYVKVGTSGTGGMGLNIPYTHGEEKPSRLLLSKAALAGAQSLLTFLMARTPEGPQVVKEIKPAAVIAWREIGYGPIRSGGRSIPLYDSPPDRVVSIREEANLAAEGKFGVSQEGVLEGAYIHTGENGQFSAGEFTAITALGQMELVTPEEIARAAVRELTGGNSGHDVVAALDGAIMGPSYRGGFLRQAALDRLHDLEAEHGESIAFEILGPPRLSKLLYEAYLLKRLYRSIRGVLEHEPDEISAALERHVCDEPEIRKRMISIGIPVLLADGDRLLRGPRIKSEDAYHGWVDLTSANMATWQQRLEAICNEMRAALGHDTSSAHDRNFATSRKWLAGEDDFDIGEVVAWIFNNEEQGRRGKT